MSNPSLLERNGSLHRSMKRDDVTAGFGLERRLSLFVLHLVVRQRARVMVMDLASKRLGRLFFWGFHVMLLLLLARMIESLSKDDNNILCI